MKQESDNEIEKLTKQLTIDFSSKLLLQRAEIYQNGGNITAALQDALTAFNIDKSPAASEKLRKLYQNISQNKSNSINELLKNLSDIESVEIKEQLEFPLGQKVSAEMLEKLIKILQDSKHPQLLQLSKLFLNICSSPCNLEVCLSILSNTSLEKLSLISIEARPFVFQSYSAIISNAATKEPFSITTVEFLLLSIYKLLLLNEPDLENLVYKCLLMAMCNEQIVLHFFKYENIKLCRRLFEKNTFRPLLIALLSCCFSKISSEKEQEILHAIDQLIDHFFIESNNNGLYLLSAIFQGGSKYGGAILMKDHFMEKIVGGIDGRDLEYQQNSVEIFSYAANIPEIRKQISPIIFNYLTIAWKSVDLKLKSFATVTMIKITPDSKNAEKLLLTELSLDEYLKILQYQELYEIALEGLVYLSLYPSMKKKITEHTILESLKKFVVTSDSASLYAVLTTINNLIQFEKPLTEEEKQVRKLHQMAKSLPENDPLNSNEKVHERIEKVVNQGFVPLICKIKTDRKNIMGVISEIALNLATETKYRGLLVQNQICPLLTKYSIKLAEDENLTASHALAKIIISTNPMLAFKGEQASEVIRPLMVLLTKSSSGLCQFEAMLALTNLASMNDSVRLRILQLNGLSVIENLQFSDHVLIRRAATELICNLIYHPLVFEKYLQPKCVGLEVLIALMDDDDFETKRAASGAIAVLSSEKSSIKIFLDSKRFLLILVNLIDSGNEELVHRGSEIVKNILKAGKEFGEKLPIDLLDMIDELSKSKNKGIAACNKEAAEICVRMGLFTALD